MRFLKHKVGRKISTDSKNWGRLNIKDKIFFDVPTEFISFINRKVGITSVDEGSGLTGRFIYITTGDGGSSIFVTSNVSLAPFEAEGIAVSSSYFTREELVKKGGITGVRNVYRKYVEVKSYDKEVERAKNHLDERLRVRREKESIFIATRDQLDIFERYNIVNGILEIVFEDVVAEDTQARGEDIKLGTLKFNVDVNSRNVMLVDGSYPRNNSYNDRAFHPHMLSNSICLGSQESDYHTAVANMEYDVVQAILYKFAHSYTSTDDAGSYWKRWRNSDNNTKYHYIDYLDEDVEEQYCQWCEEDERWIHADDAVYVEHIGSYLHIDDTHYSEYNGQYIKDSEAVHSDILDTWILEETAVYLENDRGWIPADSSDYEEYDGKYYHNDDLVEVLEHEDKMPITNCVWSSALDAYILANEARYYEGDFYTEDTLPNKTTQEDSDLSAS